MGAAEAPWALAAGQAELLDAVAVPAWLLRSGAPLRGNPALQRLAGLNAEGLAAREHLQMVCEEDRDALAAATEDALHGSGEPPAQLLRLRAGATELRPVELTLRRLGPGSALVSCVDHSDFQHVQNMLQSMSALLSQIVDGAPVASFVIDASHRITHWNSACWHLTGCTADQMIGSQEAWRAFYDQPRPLLADLIVDGLDAEQARARLGQDVQPSSLIAGALEKEAFFERLGAQGLWLNFTAAPLRDHGQRVIGAIVTLQDVSQRRRTEEELTRQLEAMVEVRSAELAAHTRVMDAFVDNAPMGVAYAEGAQVLRSNRKMAEIFGAAEPGAEAGFYLNAEDVQAVRKVAAPALQRGQPLHHEMWLRHRSGRRIWVQLNACLVDPENGGRRAWWMVQDRSEMRAAQEELRSRFEQLQVTNQKLEQAQNQLLQQDKMASIGQLAAGVAHEINNPVGFVSSNLHSLRHHVGQLLALAQAQAEAAAVPQDAAAAQRAAAALQEAELDYLREDLPLLLDESADGLARVKKIVQDLKDFSRVDQAEWQLADLNAGLESTLNVVRHEIKYKAEVVKQLAPLPAVLCLAGQLNQVFMNLIVNASHAIAEHGRVTLSTGHERSADAEWVWVQVEDNGCGMTEEVRRRIFEPFFTTKAVGKGTGLGLSLSFSIVQRHGGALQVRSQPGQGSAFRVWVPVAGPAGDGAQPAPPAWA